MQQSKIIILFHAAIIEVVSSNIRKVITNRVIIIGYIFRRVNIGTNEVMVS